MLFFEKKNNLYIISLYMLYILIKYNTVFSILYDNINILKTFYIYEI